MKKSNIYVLLLMGVLIAISYLYSNMNNYDEPTINSIEGGLFKSLQVGDLFVLQNDQEEVSEFFKVVGNPKADLIAIVMGNSSYNQNFNNQDFLNNDWIIKGINRSIYFDSTLEQLPLHTIKEKCYGAKTCSGYRINYPPDQFPLFAQLLNSPLAVVLLIILFFFLIWLADIISLFLSSRFKYLSKKVVLFILGCCLFLFINWIQFQGYLTYAKINNLPRISFVSYTSIYNVILESLPIFFLFHFLKNLYFQQLEFAEQEVAKLLTILVGGVVSQLMMVTLIYWFVPEYEIPGINYYSLDQMGYNFLTKGMIVNCGIFAIANFLNNLRKHLSELRFKAKRLIRSEEQTLTSQSELNTLQAKVNPHFLYNSLNSLASLAQTNPSKTEEMALALSDFYKYSINRQENPWSTIEKEIELLKVYLGIEKIRFGERLQYTIEMTPTISSHSIPHFLLQPVVENAIKHGFDLVENKINISIKILSINKALHIEIQDSGPPFSDQLNTGYGLRSVKKKLKLLYPNKHEIHFMNQPNKQVHIILNK